MATLKRVEWPESRENLINDLKSLSDLDYQKKVWCTDNRPYGITNELDYICNDSDPLDGDAEEVQKYLGLILRSVDEANILVPLIKALDKINKDVGSGKKNEEYLSSPLWDELLKSAKVAYNVLQKGDKEAHHENTKGEL